MSPIISSKSEVEGEGVSFPKSDETTIIVSENQVFKSGNVLRLNILVPFFLQNDVFTKFKKADYSWVNKEGMVLLVENLDNGKSLNTVIVTKKSSQAPDYSIGGCPLECPFDLNEDFDEALVIDCIPTVFNVLRIPTKFSPLSINDGRWAIRQAIIQNKPFVEELNLTVQENGGELKASTPVFAFVDCMEEGRPLTLTGFKGDSEAFNVRVMGRFRPDAEILDIKTFRSYHEMNVLTFDNRPTTAVAHAVYEKLHGGEHPSRGKVYIEFIFKDPTKVFALPPEESLSKIAIRPLPGDANPSMKSLWSEIEDLERWIGILSSCSESAGAVIDGTSFLNASSYSITEDRLTDTITAVQELLAKEPAVDFYSASSSTEISDSLDMVLQRVVQQERTDCDFTDRIWSVVRKCDAVEELQECLQLIFQNVANKMYRPYLLLTNNTIMAKNLTKVMKGEMASLLQMTHHRTMVKVVIECGLQKLFKDYNFALAMSHLIERGEVNNFTPAISDITTSLNNLKKLHCVLEVMCLSKERLTLSVNIQEGHVKQMLKKFSESKVEQFDWDQTYHFDVLSNDIRRAMTGLHPFYFKVKMDSKTLLKWATTTVVVSTEQYISYKRHPSDEVHSRLYYVYLVCQSGRLEG